MRNTIQDLVTRLKEKLKNGVTFNNPRLANEANKFFGGQRGGGHYNPRDAYDALEAAANLLLLEERATYLMGSPAREALDELRRFAEQLPTQVDRTREQVEMQQFSTPPPLAYVAARMLTSQQGEVVLEPSAGTGSLAIWPRAIGAKVICNEIAPRRKALLEMLGFETHSVDAELLDDLLPPEIKPAGILMNPPFSATNGRVARHDPVYGARHVETALRRLEKGGRLVAITSAAMAIGPSRFADWWRRVARAYNVRASVTIAGGEFAKSGTSVDAQLIVIDKYGPTHGDNWKEQLENIERGRFDSLEEAWEKLKGLANRAPREESPEEEAPAVFAPYQVARLTGGRPHPAEIVEAASMAAVRPPIVTYRPTLPQHVVEEGALSDIQLERVIYAGQRHEQRLPDGARGGFFVGDGTGLGKGRSLAAIVLDNWNKGRKRAVWFSVNNDLMDAAKRDLNDIGAGSIPIARVNDYPAGGEIGLRQGVIFSTYSSLISQSKDGRRRIDQIQRWLGRDGVLVLDECVPGDTKIATPDGERPIKDLKVGDLVLGYNHETGAIEPTPVLHLFRRESAEPLHQVHGAKMTGNHPVWTQERGYVRADSLTPFDNIGILERGDSHERAVFHLRVVPSILRSEVSGEQKAQRREAAFLQHVLFREMADEPPRLCKVTYHQERPRDASGTLAQGARARRRAGKVESAPALTDIQSLLLGDHSAQSAGSIKGEELRTSYWRQRQWTDCPAANAARLFGLDCGVYRSGQSLAAGPAKALQIGHRQPDRQNRHRDRRAVPPYASRQRKRQEEGGLSTLARVDSAQVSERGNPTRPQFCDAAHRGSHVVYNIETGTGNYFADSLLVHNCHKAKNALAGAFSEPTQTGQAVIDLQSAERNPEYRIVYSSATGATDVRHMVYMTRLGLWGLGTSFPSGFNQFLNEIEAGGVGAMELLSRDMKALGMYLSGSISFGTCPRSGKAVEYREVVHRLTPEQREMYDRAAAAWQHVLKNIHEAVRVTGGNPRARSLALNKFWGDHQRFFRQIICAFKTPTVIAETKRALAEGKSVVISLIGTGEARTQDKVGRALEAGATLEDLDFTPREIIAQMIERGFPTTVYQDETDPDTGRTTWSVVTGENGAPLESREALRMKQELLDGLSALHLPENPLDQIVNAFGENAVAELTGRKRRLIRDPKTGKVVYKKRSLEGVSMDRVNVHEMSQFQGGKKRIAVISSAAGMGVSLHSSNREANRQRREHIVLELSWSADQQMQFFGRTHRSDQAIPPEYVLVPTELGGERRFCSTIARRLWSLGALTKGDRSAANSADLAKYNFETAEGRAALTALFRGVMRGEEVPGLDDPRQALRDMGLLVKFPDGSEDIRREDETNVPRFLNRVLALDVSRQNAVFDHFTTIFERTVAAAKASGTFDEGVTDVRAVAVRFARAPRVVASDEITGAETTHYVLEVDRKTKTLPFEEAEKERRDRSGVFMRHKKQGHVILTLPSRYHTDVDTGATYRMFAISRPEGSRVSYMREAELEWKFRPVVTEEARELWNKRHAELPEIETSKMDIVGGAILPLWQRVKTQQGSGLRIVRVTTEDGRRIVGAQIPEKRVGPVLRALGISRNLKTPKEVFEAVWRNNEEVELVTGVVIKRTSVHKEGRIEACNLQYFHYAALRQMGLIEERIDFRNRFFIPTEEEAGVAALTMLLKAYPQIKSEEEVEEEESSTPEDIRIETEAPPIDLTAWIIPAPDVRPEPPAGMPNEVARPTAPRVVEAHPSRVMGVSKTAVQQSLFEH